METTPPSLLERLRQPGAREAWDKFVELYTPLLYFWARKQGLQAADAGDLVQDVFVLLVSKLPQFAYDPGRSFRAWLKTVLVNRCRENQRRPHPQHLPTNYQPAVVDADDLAENEYRTFVIRRLLHILEAEFPSSAWQAFEAYVIEGQDVEDVARQLGVSPSTVYATKSKILRRLRQEAAGLLE